MICVEDAVARLFVVVVVERASVSEYNIVVVELEVEDGAFVRLGIPVSTELLPDELSTIDAVAVVLGGEDDTRDVCRLDDVDGFGSAWEATLEVLGGVTGLAVSSELV